MSDWPPWRLTAAQRKAEAAEGRITADDLLDHYCGIFCGKLVWDGLPDDMPQGFINETLFWTGSAAPLHVFGQWHVVAASPVMFGIYAQPLTWLPSPAPNTVLPSDVMRSHDATENPVLWMRSCLADELRPLCVMMAKTYRCLEQTIQAMRQPVVLQGVAGGEINQVETAKSLSDLNIYSLDRAAMSAGVLDLGGSDHTQNLISTINALDCECLARMGFKSAGTEKASGITVEETVSITQELDLINRRDIELCRQWAEKVRPMFPRISVRLAPEVAVLEYGDGDPAAYAPQVPGGTEPGDSDGGPGESKDGSKAPRGAPRGGRKESMGKDRGPNGGRRRSDGEQ